MEPVNINQIQNSMQMGAIRRAQTITTPDKTQEGNENGARKAAADTAGKAAGQVEDAAAKGIYGDVLDISEDGDTVTARPEALQKLEDGMVTLKSGGEDEKSVTEMEKESAEHRAELIEERREKAEESREARQEMREEQEKKAEDKAAEDTSANIGSLKGYPDSMVDTLYRQGKIDSRTYNSEIERREEIDEMRGMGEEDQTERAAEENDAFSREMTGNIAQGEQDNRETEALFTAAENGRLDIAKDIFTDTDKN